MHYLLTVSLNDEDIREAVDAGAQGYIYKNTDPRTFIQQVKSAYAGEVAFDADMVKRLLTGMRQKRPINVDGQRSTLSVREKEVLELISTGSSNKAISTFLTISNNTTRTHIRSLMQKLHLDNRTKLAMYAQHEGITGVGGREQKLLRTPIAAA